MRIYLAFLGLSVIIFGNCTTDESKIKFGMVITKVQYFDAKDLPALHPIFTSNVKIWYKGNLSIQELVTLYINTDTTGKRTERLIATSYAFINPDTHSFYFYKNFSDTAEIIKKFIGVDSFYVYGAWNFYNQKKIEYTGSPEILDDTTIDKIIYKRLMFNRIQKEISRQYTAIAYFRCDKKGTIILFDKTLSEKMGCPMERIDGFPLDKMENPYSSSFEFVRNTLTKEELKVFEAWERNARENPVSK